MVWIAMLCMMKVRWTVLEGEERTSGTRLRILFSGDETDCTYVTKMAFNGEYRVVSAGKLPPRLFLLMARANVLNCDIMFFRYERKKMSLSARRHEFILPLWIGSSIELPISAENKSARSDVRRIIRNNLSYRIEDSPSSIENFINEFWIPTIQQRYPDKDTDRMRNGEWRKYRCELLVVQNGSFDLSGAVIRYGDSVPLIWMNGLKNGDLSLWKIGGISASYYFAGKYLHENGYDSVNLGLSRPFLNDGVLMYKKKWNPLFWRSDAYSVLLKVMNDSCAMRAFLARNQFFSYHSDELCTTVFDDGVPEEKDVPFFKGIDCIKHIDLNTFF
ncbi:hypothetical protein FP507_03780 [Chlorobium phaeovibrioides]|uniref:Uncharacterized protein n=1 Tax=Chlorobium phaeovibrioides TaxID=1094 RepID=A0A5M8ID88_CHLPH|nr:hypothetical protein [Chlorobium phaeovibrioides]KAA6232309.1 hypothetical protein FP507_03780 [Chlorobium phaeovibrioides]